MMRRWLLPLLVLLLAAPTAAPVSAEAAPESIAVKERVPFKDLPEEIQKKIIEKIKESDDLPDELKQKLLAASKEQASSESEAAEDKEEDASQNGKQEQAGEAKQEKSDEPSKSKRADQLKAKIQEMEAEFNFKVAEYKHALDEQRFQIEKMKLDRQIDVELNGEEQRKLKEQIEELKLEQQLVEIQSKLAAAKDAEAVREFAAKKSAAEARLASLAALQNLEDVVLDDLQYPDKPFKKGVLTISDRRIELNGPIYAGAAKYVADRIDYYNNASDKPIFLIIDSSPGGSAIEGLHILQAMRNSKAPVHVVVKRYAASMAAIITTLAEHSYAYPNAILLHHQASSGVSGNTTVQKEQLDRLREMSARLIGEVAEKIGITEEQFVKQMYENRSTGDWDLFADQAVKQGWVGHVVDEIRETAVRKRPQGSRSTGMIFSLSAEGEGEELRNPAMERYEVRLEEQVDERGERYIRLPRLNPLDHWFLYNPDAYYR